MKFLKIFLPLILIASVIIPFINPSPALAVADRYFVMGQVFVVDGAHINSDLDGRWATAGNKTINLTDDGTHGTFSIYMASGASGTVTSGTSTISGSPVTLAAGLNSITATGSGTCTLNLTLGTAANWNTVNSWSAGSGSYCTASVPTSSDNVYFNANSFTAASQILTVDATANCLNMDWTGALNTPTLTQNDHIQVFGSATFIAAMVHNVPVDKFVKFYGTGTLTTNGLTLNSHLQTANSAANVTVAGALTTTLKIFLNVGSFNTGNNAITCTEFTDGAQGDGSTRSTTLGTSTLTCTKFSFPGNGLTMSAASSTINVSGTGNFDGGGASYGTVNLNGTAHTVSGSNTFAALNLPPATTQTITFTVGTWQTITTATLSGDATHAHTLKSGTAGTLASIWATNKTDAYVTYTDMLRNYNGVIVANCAGVGGGTFAGAGGSFTSLTQEGSGNYALTISGNNTFNTFTVDRSVAAKTITLTAGSNQIVSSFVCATSGTRVLTVNSTAGTATLTKTGGGVLIDYISLDNNTGAPAGIWHYGTNNTIGANVNGWTAAAVPTVTTQAGSSVEETTATLNGDVTSLNLGANVTERGFDYDTNSGSPYAHNVHSNGSWGVASFTENIATLSQGTLYYTRAYAINPQGTGYSSETTFLTKPLEPTSFTAVTNGSLAIQLQCVMGTGATGVMIRFRTDGIYPTGIADGNQAYLGTSNIYNHTGLTSGTSYSYRIWSYATGGGLTSYSDLYASTDCTATIAGSVSTGYLYKKAFTVTGSACGAQTNYQVHLTINYGAGADSGSTVYLDSKAQADFDDIRFTATDGVTVLDAWLESKTDSTTASVWVELDTIPVAPGTQTFYMFYDKPSAVSYWNGTNTFVVFDDFERAMDGDTVGGSWTEVTPHAHISTEQDIGNVAGYSGTRSMKLVGGTTPAVTIPVAAGVNNYAVRYQYYKEDLASQFFKRGNGTYLIDANYAADEKVTVYDGASYVDTTLTCSKDAWGLAEFENIVWNTTMTVKTNGVSKTGVDISYAAGTYSGVVGLVGDATNDQDTWIDNFIVRKYCSAEPTITSWGAATTVVVSLQIQDAKIVTGYKATDDWLVVVRYVNTYAPYYDTYDVRKYFVLQLVNDSNIVVAQSPLLAWGNRVGSIYLSPTVTSALTYGGSYTVRIYGTFVTNPYVEYTLIGADWLGSDLANLDSWVVTSATVIGTYYSTAMTTYIAERGEVLNSTGSGVFSLGIAGLAQVRPAIFQTYTVPSAYTPGTITQAGRTGIPAWQTNVGPDATIMLTRLGNIVGIGGDIIAVIAFLIMMFVLMALAFPAGHTTAAMVLSLPVLAGAIWFGMDLLYIGMLALVAAFLFIKNFWLDKGN